MILVDSLCRSFGATQALRGVSFAVDRGEVAGLLGPNGAGKTTCMRILSGFLAPSAGTAHVGELRVDDPRRARAARRLVGYLPEGAPLYPEMRVAEYLAFRARLRGIPRRERQAAVERSAERCGLTDVWQRIAGQLSRGYRQRVGLADVLLADPPVLVLDEPTAGLDPNQIREVETLIAELAAAGRTVLLSSHILAQVEAVCGRLLILHRGELVAQGTPEEVSAGGERTERLVVVVRTDGPAEEVVERLGRLDGVTPIAHDPSGTEPTIVRCSLRAPADPAARERVAAAVLESGWGLRELRSEAAVLEEVFAELTADARNTSGRRA